MTKESKKTAYDKDPSLSQQIRGAIAATERTLRPHVSNILQYDLRFVKDLLEMFIIEALENHPKAAEQLMDGMITKVLEKNPKLADRLAHKINAKTARRFVSFDKSREMAYLTTLEAQEARSIGNRK